MSGKRNKVSERQQDAVEARRPKTSVVSRPAKDTNASTIYNVLDQLSDSTIFINPVYRELVGQCTWLKARDPSLTTLLCEISASLAVDPDTTESLLTETTEDPEEIYWKFPSLSVLIEKYDVNVETEFSIIGATEVDTPCPVCSSRMAYVNIKPPASSDEAADDKPVCAVCHPRM